MKIKLLIADDQELVRAGLIHWFAETEVEVVAEATTIDEAVRLAAERAPDVALVETQLRGADAFRVGPLLKHQRPQISVLFFSTLDNAAYAARALAAEASGYLLKSYDRSRVLEAIRSVAQGRALWQSDELRRLRGALATGKDPNDIEVTLTPRELEVLAHLAQGLTNKEIARLLGISAETVKEHVQRMLRKIGVRDRTQAAVWMARRRTRHANGRPTGS